MRLRDDQIDTLLHRAVLAVLFVVVLAVSAVAVLGFGQMWKAMGLL